MNWVTIYIRGRAGFKDEVRRKLEYSRLEYMPGNSGDYARAKTHDLYWLAEGTELREMKKVIGAKLVWKYRLRFYDNLEDFIASEHAGRKVRRLPDVEPMLY